MVVDFCNDRTAGGGLGKLVVVATFFGMMTFDEPECNGNFLLDMLTFFLGCPSSDVFASSSVRLRLRSLSCSIDLIDGDDPGLTRNSLEDNVVA